MKKKIKTSNDIVSNRISNDMLLKMSKRVGRGKEREMSRIWQPMYDSPLAKKGFPSSLSLLFFFFFFFFSFFLWIFLFSFFCFVVERKCECEREEKEGRGSVLMVCLFVERENVWWVVKVPLVLMTSSNEMPHAVCSLPLPYETTNKSRNQKKRNEKRKEK